jgi:hypothetical protein
MNDREASERWARRTAEHLVDGMLSAVERLPLADQMSLLRAIAKRALWRMPNSSTEARDLAKYLDIENLRQPHPRDDPPDRD